jgi:hypothetical protein
MSGKPMTGIDPTRPGRPMKSACGVSPAAVGVAVAAQLRCDPPEAKP